MSRPDNCFDGYFQSFLTEHGAYFLLCCFDLVNAYDSDLVNACDSEFVDTYTNDLVNFLRTHVCGKMIIYKYCRQHTV